MAVWIEPVTLDGEHVVLEPLTADHAEALAEVRAIQVSTKKLIGLLS